VSNLSVTVRRNGWVRRASIRVLTAPNNQITVACVIAVTQVSAVTQYVRAMVAATIIPVSVTMAGGVCELANTQQMS